MTIVYDPLQYRTLVSKPGEVPYKFWAVNKLLRDMAAAGVITLIASDLEPLDTSVIWLDIAAPEIDGGVPKAHTGASWTVLTKALFLAHLGGGGGLIDGDYGDIVVSAGGTLWTLDAAVLAGFAPAVHTHTIAQVTGLQTALDNKLDGAASINALADVVITTPTAGQALKYNGTNWINDTDATGGGVTDGDKGDVTVSGTGTVWTVDADAVTNAKLANVPTATFKGRVTAATGDPEDLTVAQAKALLNLAGTNSGDQTSIVGITGTIAQFNTACTDADFATGGGTATGSNTGDNAVNTLYSGLVTNANHTGDATGSTALTLATVNSNVGSFGLAASVAQFTVNAKGLITAAVNVAISIASTAISDSTAAGRAMLLAASTAAQTALLDVFTAGAKGLAPASGGGTTNFLRADGVFAAPPGAGGGEANTASNVGVAGVGVFKQKTGLDLEFKKINAGAANVTITDDTANNEIDINVNGYSAISDGTTSGVAVGGDTFKLRAGAGLAVRVQNNDATHGDNALFEAEPRRSPIWVTDFLGTNTAMLAPFTISAISTGTFTTVPAAGVVDGNHPGVILARSSTTANSGVLVTTTQTIIRIAGGEKYDLVFRTPAALTNLTYRFGYHDTATSADAVDGVYFEMPATGAIVGKTSNNSTRTASATIATLVAATWYHARIVVNANATGADFFVYDMAGAQLGTVNITTNIPTASGRECGVAFVGTNSGTTAVDIVNLDYMAAAVPGRTLLRGALT